jgi:hypothetical protein
MNDGLGIAMSVELMAAPLKLCLQFAVVIDFSIEDNQHALIFVKHWLLTARQINNGEAAHPQGNPIACPDTLVIWTPVPDDLTHLVDKLPGIIAAALSINESGYPTHSALSFRIPKTPISDL